MLDGREYRAAARESRSTRMTTIQAPPAAGTYMLTVLVDGINREFARSDYPRSQRVMVTVQSQSASNPGKSGAQGWGYYQ